MFDRNVSRRTFISGSAAASTALFAGCQSIRGSSGGSAEYPSKDMTFIVTFSAGGGFDTYTRGLARHLPDHLSSNINYTIENKTPSFTGLMDIWRADSDGYTVGTSTVLGNVGQQIVSDVPYDMREFTWIARMARTKYMIAAGSNTDYSSVGDLQSADEIKLATPGEGTTAWLASIVSATDLDINFSLVNFGGTQEAAASVLRGDADALLGPTTSPSLTEPLSSDNLQPIVSFTEEPPEVAPNSATAVSIGREGLMDLNLTRPIFGPPGISSDRASTLSDAIVETLKSDSMQQWAEENNRPIDAAGTEEMTSTVTNAFDKLSQYEDLLSNYLGE